MDIGWWVVVGNMVDIESASQTLKCLGQANNSRISRVRFVGVSIDLAEFRNYEPNLNKHA